MKYLIAAVACLLLLLSHSVAFSQCMYRPVSLQDRVDHATGIVAGRIVDAHSYWDAAHENIYTLYRFQVDGWLKGADRSIQEIGVIAMGGVVDMEAQETYPTVRLYPFNDYVLFLEGDNHQVDDRSVRSSEPNLIQTFVYADQQGALTKQWGTYHDHMRTVDPMDEAQLFSLLEGMTGSEFNSPDGKRLSPRVYVPPMSSGAKVTAPITSFSPNPTQGGTIVTTDFVTITGSGFGAAAGTVFYSNADDGGATFTATGIASDNVAWSDVSIQNKVAPNAGTGPINVNGAMTSGSNLTLNYGHSAINSTFSGFGSSTRQRYYHRNFNGAGGMYFLYNTTSGMSANAPARAAFERALERWRCLTFINWFSNGTTATGFAADGVNIVMFDGTLPVGVLGRATSRFSGSATGGCQLANTVWCVNEIDVQFFTDPPTAGFPWEYGPAAPAFTEYDFESVAVHELGHGHGLQHRIAAGSTMHFAIANGSQARTPAAQEVTGGAVRMAYSSAATCFNPAAATCGNGPMTLLTAGTCTLPVEVLDFHGEYVEGQGNVLTWTAMQEYSLLGYFVERSLNGRDFETIEFVQAEGNGQDMNQYGYIDMTPGLPTRCFYRLNERDQNGESEFSNTIEVMRPGASMHSVAFDALASEWVVRSEMDGNLTLSDIQGRILLEMPVQTGFSRIPAPKLPAAVYLWRISTGQSAVAGKVLVRD